MHWGEENYGKKHSEWGTVADGEVMRKDLWERGAGVSAERPTVCVYGWEYKWACSHRMRSLANYFLLGKVESQGDRRWRQIDERRPILPSCTHWLIKEQGFLSQRFVREQQQSTLWVYYCDWKRRCTEPPLSLSIPPSTEVSLSNAVTPSSSKLLNSELPVWVEKQNGEFPSEDAAARADEAGPTLVLKIITIITTVDIQDGCGAWSSLLRRITGADEDVSPSVELLWIQTRFCVRSNRYRSTVGLSTSQPQTFCCS